MDSITAVGGIAAFCTSVSYLPLSSGNAGRPGRSDDLSLRMLLVLWLGVAL
jgi:hypothetical protein